MKSGALRSVWPLFAGLAILWLAGHLLVPFFLPFALGWGLAALVQPQVEFLEHRLRLPRRIASAAAVSCALVLVSLLTAAAAGIVCRQAAVLVRGLPGAVEELTGKSAVLQRWLLEQVARMPPALARILRPAVTELFAGGSILLEGVSGAVLAASGKVLGGISGGALMVGTAVVSSYLISGRYPQLCRSVVESSAWVRWGRPTLHRMRTVLGGWLGAQLRLSAVTFALTAAGFWLLRAQQTLLWAAVTAVVDAVPMLGTGTVLVPMAAVSLLWGSRVRAVGLLGLYLTAAVTRSVLEPKLVGSGLGLNPLMTLLCMYTGYRILGIPGMILAPMATVLAAELGKAE